MVSKVVSTSSAFSQFKAPSMFNNDGYFFSVPTPEQKEETEKHYGKKVIIVGGGLALAVLGLVFGIRKFKFGTKLVDKLFKIKDRAVELRMDSQKAVSNAGNNVTNLKDTLAKKVMYSKKFNKKLGGLPRKIHKGITDAWIGLATFNLGSKQGAVAKELKKLSSGCQSADAKKLMDEIAAPFTKEVRKTRFKAMKSGMNKPAARYFKTAWKNLGEIKNKDTGTYLMEEHIANELVAPNRKQIQETVAKIIETNGEKIQKLKKIGVDSKRLDAIGNQAKKVLEIEKGKYFDTVRDQLLGSAFTDVTSVVTGVATAGIGIGATLSKLEDKDARTSVMLKYGIPVLGAIAMQPLTTMAFVAGLKSVIVSACAGVVLNQIITPIDNLRKKIAQNKTQTAEPQNS